MSVYYEGWGERWLLGNLADNGKQLLFEYSERALKEGLELSPYKLKLSSQAYGDLPMHLNRLPGLISDALPDGWGLMLMDRLFRKSGRNASTLSPLDRLAFIGNRAMGALVFAPADLESIAPEELDILELSRQAYALANRLEPSIEDSEFEDSESEVFRHLKQLALLGGSPHGARPKALVYYNPVSTRISSQIFEGGEPWLVKFQAMGEHKEACAIEQLYAELARACGLNMPDTAYFDLDKHLAAFGIKRFDVADGLRVPVHTLAGVLHADFRTVGSVDYTTLLRITRFLTRDEQCVREAFERCVFNVLFNNRDDHAKNFSFRLNKQRQWQLAPGYDLTFNEGPGGEHQMDIMGHGKNITRELLLKLATSGGLAPSWANEPIDRMLEVGLQFNTLARSFASNNSIRSTTIRAIQNRVKANAALLI
ncbi:MAG: type II toxin-antitoxin system HipA family toxin [Limnobacter sp.]|nr:type II toxin-antitoxin system HipA family toxin [Limnobacter sp.]